MLSQGLEYGTSESGKKGMMGTSTDHVQRVMGRKRDKGTSLHSFHHRFPYNLHKNIPPKLILGRTGDKAEAEVKRGRKRKPDMI